MNKINRIRIQGYKSIRDQEIELRPINVLIGANGSGKSNFVSLFNLLHAAMDADSLRRYVALKGRANSILRYGAKTTPEMVVELEYDAGQRVNHYRGRLVYAADDSLVFSEEEFEGQDVPGLSLRVTVPGPSRAESALTYSAEHDDSSDLGWLMGQFRPYQFNDTSERAGIRQHGYVNDGSSLRADAANIAAVLYGLRQSKPDYYQRILSTIRLALPFFDDFILEPTAENANYIRLDWKEVGSDYRFGAYQIADGALRFIALTTLLLQPTDMMPSVIIIDEPELGLHPYAISLLASMIRGVSLERQVIVATQSTELLDQFEVDDVIVVNRREKETVFERPNADELKEWLEDYTVSELWRKNVIGGGPYRWLK